MAFTPKQITKELDFANLAKHNDNYNAIKTELDSQASTQSTHAAAQTAHGSTAAATPGKIMQRDSAGRAKVAAPAAADDVARKAEVDKVQTNLDTHTGNADIHVTKPDKNKWNNHVDNPDIHVTKAQKDNWDSKAPGNTATDLAAHKADTVVHVTKADHDKLNGIASGAEVNQNAFSKVNDIPATSKTDTVKIVAGTGIAVTTNPADKSVNITATGTATPGKHATSHLSDGSDPIPEATTVRSGLMSAQDKQDIIDIKGQIDATNLSTTLGPGTSVINADQASATDLTVYGRSLANVVEDGDCTDVTKWTTTHANLTKNTDAAYVSSGTSSFKVAVASGQTTAFIYKGAASRTPVKSGTRCVAIADVRIGDATRASLRIANHPSDGGTVITVRSAYTSDNTKFVTLFAKMITTQDGTISPYVDIEGAAGQYAYVDSVRLYTDIPEVLYNRIGVDITSDNINVFFPFVDGVQHVQGVGISHPSKNLLPSAPDSLHANAKVTAPYELTLNATGVDQVSRIDVNVAPGQKYTLNADFSGYISVQGYDKNGVATVPLKSASQPVPTTFTVPATTVVIQVRFGSSNSGTFTFRNWQLELGDKATPFEPAKPQQLILPVTLGSTPDGSVRDSAYYDHELSKWRKVQRVDWSGEAPTVLATPVFSDIQGAEGAISLHPGGNQITVETGVVQREKAKPNKSSTGTHYHINDGNRLTKRVASILQVYKGVDPDPAWQQRVGATGIVYAVIKTEDYDPNADYYVTYTTLDKYDYTSNVTQLDVSYKAGISATLSDVVSGSAELKAQNDRQDFADTYIQAYAENNRKDIDALSDRLNTASTAQLTLQPGLQTVKAARAARFNLGSIKGKSEINGSGRIGIVGVENPYIFRRASKSADAEILSMLAFQTELHANPTDGSEPDELFEQGGEYRKLAKWKKVVLDGSLDWRFNETYTGYKRVWLISLPPAILVQFLTKFDGKQLALNGSVDIPGTFVVNNQDLYITIANADSGWGDAYTPTADEIKAYFNGWRMCDGNTSQLYTGAAGEVKCWGAIAHPSNVIGSNGWFGYVLHDVPTYKAPVTGGYEYHPYNLLYRLAADAVEPVVSEGCLTLSEGDNVVEVGTGIVLRERANPYINTGLGYVGINAPSSPNYPGSGLNNKLDRFLEIFRNSAVDKGWNVQKANYGGGNEYADISLSSYDPFAAYSVTYLKLDKSPVVPITGEIAANEKAQLVDLTAGVAEALHGVSVLAMEKAEKDAPGWITPTLLNGWIRYGAKGTIAKYYKDQFGLVHIVGLISNGVLGTVVFQLPVGYRPKLQYNFGIVGSNIGTKVPMHCSVNPTGEIIVQGTANEWTSLDGIVFEAEQ